MSPQQEGKPSANSTSGTSCVDDEHNPMEDNNINSDELGGGSGHSVDSNGVRYSYKRAALTIQKTIRRTTLFAVLISVLGCAACAGFMFISINSAMKEVNSQFERRASELVQEIESSWRDYEVAGNWLHEACRHRNISRQEFREVYDYIRSGGLEFQAVEFIPNVTHAERLIMEQDAEEYFATEFPDIKYRGFVGFEPVNDSLTDFAVQPRSKQPFYFPVHFVEPLESNAAAIDLDLYSSPKRRETIESALRTWSPVLTDRLQLVQETDASAFSVLLMHPGIQLQAVPDHRPRDLSLLVIRIPSLLQRSVKNQAEQFHVYLYDMTRAVLANQDGHDPNHSPPPQFLGGVRVLQRSVRDSHLPNDTHSLPTVSVEEMELDQLRQSFGRSTHVYEESIQVASSTWAIVVFTEATEFSPNIAFEIFGGTMIFLACMCFAAWIYTNMRRVVKIQELQAEAEAERAIISSLFPSNVRERLIRDSAQLQQQQDDDFGLTQDRESIGSADSRSTLGTIGKRRVRFSVAGLQNPQAAAASATKSFLKKIKSGADSSDLFDVSDHLEEQQSLSATSESIFGGKPIADFVPEATIMFADMVGFTAWASVREPTQVFTLLETIYHSFDTAAKRIGVFKLETIGDCYVAVAGVPEPRKDHAVAMAKFATECLQKMNSLTRSLETTLGPDTGDLQIRVGIHSGPVTAGVLRGDNCRFQLFGDTMNTASRMESNGSPSRIQISEETADFLRAAGKGIWTIPRKDKIVAKGKGELQTYWLDIRREESNSSESSGSSAVLTSAPDTTIQEENVTGKKEGNVPKTVLMMPEQQKKQQKQHRLKKQSRPDMSTGSIDSGKLNRLIHWNVDVLLSILKKVVARRVQVANRNNQSGRSSADTSTITSDEAEPQASPLSRSALLAKSRSNRKGMFTSCNDNFSETFQKFKIPKHKDTIVSELRDIVTLPKFEPSQIEQLDFDCAEVDENVVAQLTDYVSAIARLYHHHPFHNFEHASHVTMSVNKLLSRVVNPNETEMKRRGSCGGNNDDDDDDEIPLDVSRDQEQTKSERRKRRQERVASALHNHTYGIWSDPLTQFACVFSALVHDVDHPGVPNSALVQEQSAMAKKFENQSIAEQNSFLVAWDLLMKPDYEDFRNCLFGADQHDYMHFRQLLVNIVLATDISDQTFEKWRKARWNLAFSPKGHSSRSLLGRNNSSSSRSLFITGRNNSLSHFGGSTSSIASHSSAPTSSEDAWFLHHHQQQEDSINLKATIVIEHLIQASDVAHTMQHWQVFRRWHERDFHEMYHAYQMGRLEQNPAVTWYEEGKTFFVDYVIPLAHKLETCGVFGVTSDEYLDYAKANCKEWENQGEQLIQTFVESYNKKYGQ